jgi:hypothetical protein
MRDGKLIRSERKNDKKVEWTRLWPGQGSTVPALPFPIHITVVSVKWHALSVSMRCGGSDWRASGLGRDGRQSFYCSTGPF